MNIRLESMSQNKLMLNFIRILKKWEKLFKNLKNRKKVEDQKKEIKEYV